MENLNIMLFGERNISMTRQLSPNRKNQSLGVSAAILLLMAGMACNLPLLASDQETKPLADVSPTQPIPEMTPRIDTNRPTEAPTAAPADPQPAPDDASEPAGDILPADSPAIPDCNAFDIPAFNAIVDGTFNFVMQDQLNNCHYESDNGFRLTIGGGKPSSSGEMQTQFNSTFGAIPGSSWEAIDKFYLGMSFSSASVSAQGVSGSGHAIVVVAAAQPGSTPGDINQIFSELARESARQLNQQW